MHSLGDPGKSKRAEKYGTKKSKERRKEPLGTISPDQFQTVAAVLASGWFVVFWHQSEARTAATVKNWSGETYFLRAERAEQR